MAHTVYITMRLLISLSVRCNLFRTTSTVLGAERDLPSSQSGLSALAPIASVATSSHAQHKMPHSKDATSMQVPV